jgi:DnaK suppressor protein
MTMTPDRAAALRRNFTSRQYDLQRDVHDRMRGEREADSNGVRDMVNASDAHVERDMSFALLQMRTEALANVEQTLARVDAGGYGVCTDCGIDIPAVRLQALPFAVRCRMCASPREQDQRRARANAQQHSTQPGLADMLGV